jgi:hypothetical protein
VCRISEGFVNNSNIICVLDEPAATSKSNYRCWCLRVGSYNANGREGDAFLLLKKEEGRQATYRRVGFAEADAWFDRKAETQNSGLLKAPELETLYVI